MISVPVMNIKGETVETIDVDPAKLGGEIRHALLKQALVMYHANLRQGTVRTKRRGEVAGSTRKMFKQKGTGNARTGGIRNPIKVGGGHAKQKLPKDWRLAMPKKARRAARDSAILAKLQGEGAFVVVDNLTLEQPKTKLMAGVLKALKVDRSFVLALSKADQGVLRASRNLKNATVTSVAQLNAWDILRTKTLVLTKDGLTEILA